MHTTALIAATARNAGLTAYVFEDREDSDFVSIRISNGYGDHIMVTTRWTGKAEEVYTAKRFDIDYGRSILAGFDNFAQVDRFSGAHSFALLGWIVQGIQDLADSKARMDGYEARDRQREIKARAERRRHARAIKAYRREVRAAA